MLKKVYLLLPFLCLPIFVFAQTKEELKPRDTALKYYEKNNLNFRYEEIVDEAKAGWINQKLSVRAKTPYVAIYKALKSVENIYFIVGYDDKCSLMLYRENANALTKLYQSPVFRDGYSFDLKIYENENRAIILAVKREGVGDYIDTEVFELVNNGVKYLGNIAVGAIDETTGDVDSFSDKTEVTYQSGNYRIKISGKAYIPAGKKSPNKNTLVGTNVVYIYNGRRLIRGK